MTAVVLRGDARSLPLPDGSVDLIVTSPPYWNFRDYRDGSESLAGQIGSEETPQEWLEALWDCTREWMRVLKPTGSMFVDLGDKYSARADGSAKRSGRRDHAGCLAPVRNSRNMAPAKSLLLLPERYRIGCVDKLGLIARARVVWSKTTPLPESAEDRVQTEHEDIVHLVKQPRYYADLDPIREPHTGGTHARRKDGQLSPKERASVAAGNRRGFFPQNRENPLGKLPGSVWEIAGMALQVPDRIAHARCCGGRMAGECEDGLDHHAAFPMEIPRRCILGWCPPGGTVADPFGGTGTTALVADALGCHGLSFDRSAGYCHLARWRTADPGERARALGVPKPPPVIPGQLDLLTGEAS